MGFWLGPWGNQDWPEGLALHIGGPFLGAIAGAVGGAIARVRLGATVGVATVTLVLLLVVICTVVDLDQVVGVGLVLLIAGGLAGAAGGALGRLMARSHLAQLTFKDFLTVLVGGLTGAFVGFCCGLVGFSMNPRPGDDLVEAAVYLGAPFFGAITGALGGAIKRAWLSAILAPIGPVLFLLPTVLFTDVDRNQVSWVGGVLVIATAIAGASGGVIGGRMAGNRRFQFSLTAVFWLVFVCAVACGLLAVKQQQDEWWRERTVAERRCKQLGVLRKLEHFQCFPDFRPGRDMVGLRLVALASEKKGDPNDELIHLKELPNWWLERLTIEGQAFNDAGMAQLGTVLGGFTGLEVNELALPGTQITDAGLAHLEGESNLRALNLSDTSITDAGLVCLPSLKEHLRSLDLSYTRVTDTGLVHVEGLPGLEVLNLRNTQVTDEGVKKLQEALPDCEIIH
jgi:hypothetical protein